MDIIIERWLIMKDVNIVVVDDSPFFVALLTRLLEEKGFHVAGSANSKEEAVEAVKRLNPDIVTMDMIMPGADGIECTKAIHAVNPKVSVIIVTSLLDDEMIRKVHKARVSGYLHKPVDAIELTLLINRVISGNELFAEMEKSYFSVFKEALTSISNRYFKLTPHYLDKEKANVIHESRGISIVSGITGKYKGRALFDLSCETARRITSVILKQETHSKEEIVYVLNKMVTEGTKIACSKMKSKQWEIDAVSPVIFYGDSILIAKADLDTVTSEIAETAFGDIYMNVGFKKEILP